MPVQLSTKFETDLVPARALSRIRRDVNRAGGKHVVESQLPGKFKTSAYRDYPGVVRKRSQKYTAWKRKKVGHEIPNVLSGRMSGYLPANARITATANGGRVYLRNYFPMREATRQEMEAVSDRGRDRMAAVMEREFVKQIHDPANRRKRSVRKGK